MTLIQNNIQEFKQQIALIEKKYHRIPNSVSLLAVTKQQSIATISQAILGGQRAFGESYLQEALPKITTLANQNLEWHFLGPIQSNKTKKIAEHFSWVQSVTSLKIAKRLNDQRPSHLPPLNICIEVNISHESTKAGVDECEIYSLAEHCLTLKNLNFRGLMAIPAPTDDLNEQRSQFHKLYDLFQKLRTAGFSIDTLSMGMSDDWEAAIAEGATMIRIGTKLFGSRN